MSDELKQYLERTKMKRQQIVKMADDVLNHQFNNKILRQTRLLTPKFRSERLKLDTSERSHRKILNMNGEICKIRHPRTPNSFQRNTNNIFISISPDKLRPGSSLQCSPKSSKIFSRLRNDYSDAKLSSPTPSHNYSVNSNLDSIKLDKKQTVYNQSIVLPLLISPLKTSSKSLLKKQLVD